MAARGTAPPLRVGVAGTGFAGAAHVEALRRLAGVEVVAVSGAEERRARDLAGRYGIPRGYGDHDALVADPDVEAVHVCTVNRLHADACHAALDAGRHVLCEKPLALDARQSAGLAEAAARAARDGLVTAVCFTYRHFPLVGALRDVVAAREHGPAHLVHGAYLQNWLADRTDWNWRLEREEGGASRAFADIGSHWADLAEYVCGERVTEVMADLATLHETRLRPARAAGTFRRSDSAAGVAVRMDTEDFGSVLMRMGGGVRGAFTVSQVSPGNRNGLRLEADLADASLRWEQERPERAWLGRRDAPDLELVRDPELLGPRAAGAIRLPAGHPEGWADALTNAVADFVDAVRAARDGTVHDRTIATFADGDHQVALVESILASHRGRRWATVPPPSGANRG